MMEANGSTYQPDRSLPKSEVSIRQWRSSSRHAVLVARVAGVMSRVRPSPNFRPRHKNANKLRLAATVMKLRHEIDTQISSRNCARVVQNQAEVAWVEETAQSLGHTM